MKKKKWKKGSRNISIDSVLTDILKHNGNIDEEVKACNKIQHIQKWDSLTKAVSRITRKSRTKDIKKNKLISTDIYKLCANSSKLCLEECKFVNAKISHKPFLGLINSTDLANEMCSCLMRHKWNDALKFLFHLLPIKRSDTFFDDSKLKALFVLLLNHPNRNAEMIQTVCTSFMCKRIFKNDSSDYISKLLHLPAKLDYPYRKSIIFEETSSMED